MNNFEERKAEIFRRSEARLLARKKRRRILAVCVPLVLCLGILGLRLPDWKAAPTQQENVAAGGVLPGGYSETVKSTQSSLTLAWEAEYFTQGRWVKLSGVDTARLLGLLEELTFGTAPESTDGYEHQVDRTTGEPQRLRVTGAGVTEYLWEDGTLYCEQTGESCSLTAAQQLTLRELLLG